MKVKHRSKENVNSVVSLRLSSSKKKLFMILKDCSVTASIFSTIERRKSDRPYDEDTRELPTSNFEVIADQRHCIWLLYEKREKEDVRK